MFTIITCYKCGHLLIAKAGQKTKGCPYCETGLQVRKARVVAYAKSSKEASILLRKLKEKTRESQRLLKRM